MTFALFSASFIIIALWIINSEFLCWENSLLKNEVPSNMLKQTLWNFFEKSPYSGKENYEIIKIFGGFGQILSFLLLKLLYLIVRFPNM
jgi:hypothetical protein